MRPARLTGRRLVAERVVLTGVAFTTGGYPNDTTMVPIRQPDGTWLVLHPDMTMYYDDIAEARENAAGMKAEGIEEADAWELLADVMAEVEARISNPPENGSSLQRYDGSDGGPRA
jgi:hypothetical protein